MDEDVELQIIAVKQALEVEELRLATPEIQAVAEALNEQEEAAIKLVCEHDIVDMRTFFAHFSTCGLLEGIRFAQRQLTAKRDELQDKLEELQSHVY